MTTPNRSRHSSGGQAISRRSFVRKAAALSAAALTGATLLQGCTPAPEVESTAPRAPASPTPAQTIPTATAAPPSPTAAAAQASPSAAPTAANPATPPASASQATVWEALKNRKSADAFQTQPLPRQKVLDLLWAAWGINRPELGKRTAPSAMNAQEMDLYVLLADGAYLYDAKQNQLTLVSKEDLRARAVGARFRDAPVNLVFVADYARLRTGSQGQREMWSAAHCGFIGQNVYLYCAAEGLGTRFYAGIDAAGLKEALKLRAEQVVLFGQAVGYSKG